MITWLEAHLLKCFWLQWTGVECPGCGFQRSVIALLKGDLLASFHFYPALLPLMITLGILGFQLKFKWEKGSLYILLGFGISILMIMGNWMYKVLA
jgi:Protein of unknown function (DUF2752)